MTPPAAPAPRETARRVVHAAAGLSLGLVVYRAADLVAALVLGGLFLLAVLLEGWRLGTRTGAAVIHGVFGALFRRAEARRPTGAALLITGFLAAWALFPPGIAARAIIVTALADPAAAAVGSRFSGRPGRKSLVGSAAALAAALAVLLAWPTAPLPAVAAAVTAAAAERVPGPGLDNVLVPLATAGMLALLL